MWLSDYFLRKYVKEQQEKFEASPHEALEQEPVSADAKSRIVHNEIEKMNKIVMDKQKKIEPKYDYLKFLSEQAHKTVITNQKSASQTKSVSISK